LQKSGNSVVFKVIDTGIGVPKAEQARLFQKFFRAENARRARPDGTGVGLFLAKKVIDDHGGSIIFESKEGKGSTFGFRLPIA
jgi:signal transduction histidine kinase